ncbi:hypothetical protein QR680_019152 [Steinernema hermaphroditum]|uniref:Major sperm protein n=1 Tax=Steinernema hermaphroditum TaxID=289476 RepID=A0AA39LRF1_9BILA|nr:hypothetical protein QR680_019152 [Steinernema hermaphroditum]
MALPMLVTLFAGTAFPLTLTVSAILLCTKKVASPPPAPVTIPTSSPTPPSSASPPSPPASAGNVKSSHTGYDNVTVKGETEEVANKEKDTNSFEICDKCGSKTPKGKKRNEKKEEEKKNEQEREQKQGENEAMKNEKRDNDNKVEEKKNEKEGDKNEEGKRNENEEGKGAGDNNPEAKKDGEKNADKDGSSKNNKQKAKSPDKPKDITITPNALKFPEKGSMMHITITNTTDKRLAVKVKCSDNKLFRVAPVFGFCSKKGTMIVEVLRSKGPPKLDKLVIATVQCNEDCTDPNPLFKAKDANEQTTNVALNVECNTTKI